MDDLISRQQAYNLIMGQPPEVHYPSWYAEQIMQMRPAQKIEDLNKLIKALEEENKKLRERQKAQPEIIRCKDCENWDTTWKNDWAKNYHYCPLIDGTRRGDWYCADAERRTDERSD